LALQDMRDLSVAIARCRRLLDLDADPVAVDALLSEDEVLAPLVAKAPGRRVPRTVDEQELALRVVLGQQISTAAARTLAGRLVTALGEPVADDTLTHLFPTAEAVAEVDPATLAMPRTRRVTLIGLARALAEGRVDLDPGVDRTEARSELAALPGIGSWSVETIAMRGLGDPGAFLATDLGVVTLARSAGLPTGKGLIAHAERWRPWRAYAVQHLWALGDHPVNALPGDAA
jgi:AraC family transcriptional regulator of adaptative response / DNA-3-methyladenine glycosylase II